jgi:hypothetical protein
MPSALIQSTVSTATPPELRNGHAGDELAADAGLEATEPNGQGNGEPAAGPRQRTRARRKPAVGEKIKAHKLSLPESVFSRLELHAMKKGTTASAIAAEILDRNLPHHRIVTDD